MLLDLPRCSPEEAGIPSSVIEKWLEAWEQTGTEPHGFMIARKGKVCAEGWWSPYAPNLVHGLQSLSKTFEAELKMVETCFSVKVQFTVNEDLTMTIIPHLAMPGMPDKPYNIHGKEEA